MVHQRHGSPLLVGVNFLSKMMIDTILVGSDAPSTSTGIGNPWGHDLFSHGETNSFFESVKLASSGEINWNDVDVKPYCGKRSLPLHGIFFKINISVRIEFLDGFRTNPVFQQQDRDKLLNLASSLSSFFDYTGITNLAQNKMASESFEAK